MDDRPHARLDRAMGKRRVQLRMDWNQVADAAGITPEGLRAIRRGSRNPKPLTRARIEEALRWATGSVDAILAGGEPTLGNASQRRLAKYVNDRRLELDLTWDELAGRSMLQRSDVEEVRAAYWAVVPGFVRDRLEGALRWEAGSISAILGNHEPRPMEGPTDAGEVVRRPSTDEELDRSTAVGPAEATQPALEQLPPFIGPTEPDDYGLGHRPPFPDAPSVAGLDTGRILNKTWEIAKELERAMYAKHGSLSDRTRRSFEQWKLAQDALLEDLKDELGDAG